VTDKFLTDSITKGFKNPRNREISGGINYDAHITDAAGNDVEVTVYIYKEMDGFSVAVPRQFGFADPEYRNVSFGVPCDPRIGRLFEALTSDKNIGKTIKF
jgi:hypothetical protein